MNKILKIIVKEILFYWSVSSIILLCIFSIYGFNDIFKILAIISTLISKVIYEQYVANYYSNYKGAKNDNIYKETMENINE